jgi:hypothetical protein
LKALLKEEIRIGEVRNVQMKKKYEDCEKLETCWTTERGGGESVVTGLKQL